MNPVQQGFYYGFTFLVFLAAGGAGLIAAGVLDPKNARETHEAACGLCIILFVLFGILMVGVWNLAVVGIPSLN